MMRRHPPKKSRETSLFRGFIDHDPRCDPRVGVPGILLGNHSDVGSLGALGTLGDLELHLLTLLEGLVARSEDRREVHEDVVTALLLDEPVPLAVVEPLHFAYCHDRLTSFQGLPPDRRRVTGVSKR